jgi:hypothetical protein
MARLRSTLARFGTAAILVPIVVSAPLFAMVACHQNTATASATRPLSPAEGAKDYDRTPGGPFVRPAVPEASGEPGAQGEPPPRQDCPPKCTPSGAWTGCGLAKLRGSGCVGCTPRCKGKGTAEEGWYDCNGVLIIQRPCA